MTTPWTDEDLRAYLHEQLPVELSARFESALRSDATLGARLQALAAAMDLGELSLGEVWRKRRLSCPPRSAWAAYLADALGHASRGYLDFHLQTIGCRCCAANLADLQQLADPAAEERVRKIFATSVGRLRSAE